MTNFFTTKYQPASSGPNPKQIADPKAQIVNKDTFNKFKDWKLLFGSWCSEFGIFIIDGVHHV
ncbi:hypothetical protein A2Y85_00465 [candidate division WOR-3 bacterium RBG_13_43_14]|uniref:Uncharacterized protein n=1 Tax=candidate division WOR-3 bacterium RBG_13_43_14 TaxID=1802590 RepID=A0A1F4UAT0_UNCW3|nr:MAG: hypothetical protein A2Y85_00465 [candidate division WOR-3 bacterium RBG_13_43_14]